jgi:hypothetical protein
VYGIDISTTNSGVAYADSFVLKEHHRQALSKWIPLSAAFPYFNIRKHHEKNYNGKTYKKGGLEIRIHCVLIRIRNQHFRKVLDWDPKPL